MTAISPVTKLIWSLLKSCILEVVSDWYVLMCACGAVNSGDYVQAVCDRNLAENITRVLYPNDNVRTVQGR